VVPRGRVTEVAARLLAVEHVADLSVENVPVEEIVRGLFTHATGPSGPAAGAAGPGGEATPGPVVGGAP
jgi:hypothetical protein